MAVSAVGWSRSSASSINASASGVWCPVRDENAASSLGDCCGCADAGLVERFDQVEVRSGLQVAEVFEPFGDAFEAQALPGGVAREQGGPARNEGAGGERGDRPAGDREHDHGRDDRGGQPSGVEPWSGAGSWGAWSRWAERLAEREDRSPGRGRADERDDEAAAVAHGVPTAAAPTTVVDGSANACTESSRARSRSKSSKAMLMRALNSSGHVLRVARARRSPVDGSGA